MSLYGLDVIVGEQPYLCEINGVRSGMEGFKRIHGDDRVRNAAYDMLRQKHGVVSWNDGFYTQLVRRAVRYEKHPILVPLCDMVGAALRRLPLVNRVLRPTSWKLPSEKAHYEWLNEETQYVKKQDNEQPYPFEVYLGQPSTVLNVVNEILPHPLVNSYVAEELANNKFLQHRVLQDTDAQEYLIPSALVGLGAEHIDDIEEVLRHGNQFVLKPVLGSCGRGVRVLTLEEARRYLHTKGAIRDERLPLIPIGAFNKAMTRPDFIEDFVDRGSYVFEWGLALLQPMIDCRSNGKYGTVRAIVCDGRFVDAYMRENATLPVNLSKGAMAKPFSADWLPSFCEKTVACLEDRAAAEDPRQFRRRLYNEYSEERGLLSPESRNDFITSQRFQRLFGLFHQWGTI